MIDKNDIHNPWTSDDEKEHFPCIMEWWAAEAFFKSVENNKRWSLKVAFTEWFENPKKIGSISNMTLFDQDKNKHFICYSRDDSARLKSAKDGFDVSYGDSSMNGAFPHYEMHFRDPKNDIEVDFKYRAESYPFWIAQDITNGWLPIGFGLYRYGFIPKNQLSGTMRIQGETFNIKGQGYFEHVWGNFLYDTPLSNVSRLRKTIPLYLKFLFWWMENHRIKIPESIEFCTENNPFGYDWTWALFDNGWTVFYGNILFWLMNGPAMGTLILSKDGKEYKEFCDITFQYNKTQHSKNYDFYYPTEFELTARDGDEKLYLKFKMTTEAREYVSRFTKGKYWLGLVICEAPGIVEGYYSDGGETVKLSGVSKIEPQRQVSVIRHNSLKINFLKPPKGVGVSIDLDSHYLKKRMFVKIQLAPSPKIKCNFKRIASSKIHGNKM